jgi:hypothetical protein
MATITSPILSLIVRDSAESARRRLREVAHPAAAEIQGLLALHRVLTEKLRQSWEFAKDAMTEGIEVGRLRAALEPIREAASVLLDLVVRLRELAGSVDGPLANLAADEAELGALHEGATKLLDWLAAPRPPLDENQLAQSRRDIEQGRVESADSILARLRAGEDI